ncbi:MAG: PQQ-binding-like beta-propeller repeat protein [Alphaproteobacteria bacterium]
MRRAAWLGSMLAAVLVVGACEDRKTPLPGERIPVLLHESQIIPEADLAQIPVALPRPVLNSAWPEAGGSPSHVMEHVALPDTLKKVWSADIGSGASADKALIPAPVVADGKVFAMDTDYDVTAYDAETGKRLWSKDVTSADEDDSAIGGGIAFGDGRLYVTTGFAQVIALKADSGDEAWRQSLVGPSRAPPAFAGGRVYAVTIDNQIFALDGATGRKLWSHAGVAEVAGLLGGAAPAFDAGVVIVPYSSGEIYALQASNGRVTWSDNLGPARRGDIASQITDIRGLPIIDGNRVYAISHGGRMVAIDLKSGQRVWDKTLGGVQTPWVAGDYIYVLTIDAELVCLNRADGRIRWVSSLRRYRDTQSKSDPIFWNGPVLAGDRLIVTNTRSEALSISPYTGELVGKISLPGPASLAPVVANQTLYFLTDNAELVAMR